MATSEFCLVEKRGKVVAQLSYEDMSFTDAAMLYHER